MARSLRDRRRQVRNVYLNWKGKYHCKDEKYNIMVLDLTGVSGSLVGVGVLGVSRSANDSLKSGPSFQFSPLGLYPGIHCSDAALH